MVKHIILGLIIFLAVGGAGVVILRPEVVNTAVDQYAQFVKYDLSLYDAVNPQIQSREHVVRVNNVRLAAFEDTDLSFPVSGIVSGIFVKEGAVLKKGQRIASLDSRELVLNRDKAIQTLARAQSNLDKLKSGTRKEDIAVYESRVMLAETAVRSAREDLLTVISSSYTTMDGGLKGKFQSIVSVGYNSRPVLEVFIANQNVKNDILAQREALDPVMDTWKNTVLNVAPNEEIVSVAETSLSSIRTLRNLYDVTADALNALRSDAASTLSARTTVETLRSEANTALTQITNARATLDSAEYAYRVAQNELALKKAGSEFEDIRSAEALVEESRNAVLIAEDQLSKATLFAPIDGMVVKKIYPKNKERVAAGQPAVLLAAHGFKFEADIPEEDIGFVEEGNKVSVVLRSYRDREISGEVFSIDEQEVIKNDDTYFRVNILFDTPSDDLVLRTGMTGEARITTAKGNEVYVLPEKAIKIEGAKRFVIVKTGNSVEEVRLTTGATEKGMTQVIGPISTSTVVLVDK